MILQIVGEQPFQVLSTNFTIGASSSGYDLYFSADGQSYTSMFTVGAGVNRQVTNVSNGSYYKLIGNTDTVSVNWEKECCGGGGSSSAGVSSLDGQTGALTLKTINSNSLLGSGDIEIEGGSEVNYQIVDSLSDVTDYEEGTKVYTKYVLLSGYSADLSSTSGWNTIENSNGRIAIFNVENGVISSVAYYDGWIEAEMDGEWHQYGIMFYNISGGTLSFVLDYDDSYTLYFNDVATTEITYSVYSPKYYLYTGTEWINRKLSYDFTNWDSDKSSAAISLFNSIPVALLPELYIEGKIVYQSSSTAVFRMTIGEITSEKVVLNTVVIGSYNTGGAINELGYCSVEINVNGFELQKGMIGPEINLLVSDSSTGDLTTYRSVSEGLSAMYINRTLRKLGSKLIISAFEDNGCNNSVATIYVDNDNNYVYATAVIYISMVPYTGVWRFNDDAWETVSWTANS